MSFKKVSVPCVDISNVSFIVNTIKCGEGGRLKCSAVHQDGSIAPVEYEYIADSIYRVKVHPLTTGHLRLNFEHFDDTDEENKLA